MKRLTALIIGNGAYPAPGKLKNPTHDAVDLSAKLRVSGFDVTTITDASVAQMDKALKTFQAASKNGDIALFFFAGHGVQIEGENYLIALDTKTADESDAKFSSLPLNKVINSMDKAKSSTNIIILDACRNNPWERCWRGDLRGMAPVYAPRGTLIAYSTSPGEIASDGDGRNGAYTAALLQHIETPDVTVEAMFKRVRNTLSATTGGRQVSWEHTSLSGEFFFNLSAASRITDYGGSAIKDRTFVLDDTDPAHVAIKRLKSHTWPTQNPVFGQLPSAMLNKASNDSLFVLGRNILQAADGNANGASAFVADFMNRLVGVGAEKRKAVLDGMLFEIFFDAHGDVRSQPKTRMFSAVFELQAYPDLADSFDFIADCLAPHVDRYFALPGKANGISVDIALSTDGENAVDDVHVEGRSVLSTDDPDYLTEKRMYRTRARDDFEDWLANEMLVPRRLLTVTYSRALKGGEKVKFPYGFTASKSVPPATANAA
jgi:hypothetical protein